MEATSQEGTAATPVRRRTAAQVRELLIEAAQETFAAEGYAGATTRDIAHRAGVSDVLIYRHFGSKRGLFEKAVLDPIKQFIADYAATWAEHEAGSEPIESLAGRYVTGLYPLLRRHRGLVLALLSAVEFEDTGPGGELSKSSQFSALLDPIVDIVAAENEQRGLDDTDNELMVKVAFSLILGVVLLEDHLFARAVSRPGLLREMERYIHHRVTYHDRPDDGALRRGTGAP